MGAAKDRRRMAREISCVVWPQGRFGEDSRARRAHIAVNNPKICPSNSASTGNAVDRAVQLEPGQDQR
jgi:hypothetical protein